MPDNLHIAIIRLSSIGDVLHCTPVARAIKKAYPSCRLTWIVGAVSTGVLVGNPYIDEVYVWSREHWEKLLRQYRFQEAIQYWRQLRDDLHERRVDIALDVHGIFISGLATIATGASRRVGLANTKEFNSFFTTDTTPRLPGDIHVIQRYLSVLRLLNIPDDGYDMTLIVSPEGQQFADQFLRHAHYNPARKLIAINLGTTWATKNWPVDYFATTAANLYRDGQILLCGSPGDHRLAENFIHQAGIPVINAVGQTQLPEFAGLLSRCDVLLTGDTGPLHMAVALKIPTVSIFGPTNPAVYGPLSPEHIVLKSNLECVPCHNQRCRLQDLKCLYDINPQTAIAAVRKQLEMFKKNQ